MTRSEFINTVNEWLGLISFCYDEECDICDEIYSEDYRDDYINEFLVERAADFESWRDLRNELVDIPTGYDYYKCNGLTDWEGLDNNDFDDYKQDVIDWMDDHDYWDEEDDDEELSLNRHRTDKEIQVDPEDLIPIDDKDISIIDLYRNCNNGWQLMIE